MEPLGEAPNSLLLPPHHIGDPGVGEVEKGNGSRIAKFACGQSRAAPGSYLLDGFCG